nr:YkvS family protein [Neobacillus sp. Marseille-Q6967]
METANIGDVISFKRDGESYEGTITGVRENSVIVQYGYSKVKDEPLTTIVNHKNYKIKKK